MKNCINDFTEFDKLSEKQKGIIAKHWDSETMHKYLTRNPYMSEEEFFEQLDKITRNDTYYGRDYIGRN